MAVAVRAEVRGLDQILARLTHVEKAVAKKILRSIVNHGTKLQLQAAKSNLQGERTGQLRRSMGRKIKVYTNTRTWVGIVGPRRGYKITVNGHNVDPVHYAHLVEGGRRAVTPTEKAVMSDGAEVYGTHARAVPPRPFLKPAFESTLSQVESAAANIAANGVEDAGNGK